MLDQQIVQGGLTIYNFQLDLAELMSYFAQYDPMYFFCPKYSRSVVETAVMTTLEEITNYDPLKADQTLMSSLVKDIEIYYAKNPHPSLEDSDFLNKLEITTGQIEECVAYSVRNKLPMNQQCNIFWPKWIGNTLVFALRIY